MFVASLLSILLAAVAATAAPLVPPCDVDLTTRGFPACVQLCQDWCWATVIGEFEDYYKVSRMVGLGAYQGVTPKCRRDECGVVSQALGTDCCGDAPGGCDSGQKPCGEPAPIERITSILQQRIPSAGTWTHYDGIPPESTVAALLAAGHPVGRLVPGHIDAVVGCRPGKDGGTEYRLVDSTMDDPLQGNWMANYTWLMTTPWYPSAAALGVIIPEKALEAVQADLLV